MDDDDEGGGDVWHPVSRRRRRGRRRAQCRWMMHDGSIDRRALRARPRCGRDGWMTRDERRASMDDDRSVDDDRVDRVDPRGRERCARIDRVRRVRRSASSSSSSNGAGVREIWFRSRVSNASGVDEDETRGPGGGDAAGEWTNDASGGRSWTRSVGGARRRERETRRGIGDARGTRDEAGRND